MWETRCISKTTGCRKCLFGNLPSLRKLKQDYGVNICFMCCNWNCVPAVQTLAGCLHPSLNMLILPPNVTIQRNLHLSKHWTRMWELTQSCVFVVGVVSQVALCALVHAQIHSLRMCACVCVRATYYDADVFSNKVLEHLDDILLRSGFLEVCSTRAVTFLKESQWLRLWIVCFTAVLSCILWLSSTRQETDCVPAWTEFMCAARSPDDPVISYANGSYMQQNVWFL